jgi:hypothetical protein
MDYKKYEKLKEMFLGTWEHLVPKMPTQDKRYISLNGEYGASVARWTDGAFNEYQYILKLYYLGTWEEDVVFSISFNTSSQYLSTFDLNTDGMRIAFWKEDHPRYYALYDPTNAKNGQQHTFIAFPFPEEYFFQRMTVQETLPEEDYALWDEQYEKMINVLYKNDHPAISIGMVLKDYDLDVQKVLQLLVPYLDGEHDVKDD